MFVAVMLRAGACRAADAAIGAARLGQQGADGDEAAAALGSAAQATVGLSWRAWTRGILAFQRRQDLGIGQNVAGTNNHQRRAV